eukprot:5059639-Amphidinium_carterae.2
MLPMVRFMDGMKSETAASRRLMASLRAVAIAAAPFFQDMPHHPCQTNSHSIEVSYQSGLCKQSHPEQKNT